MVTTSKCKKLGLEQQSKKLYEQLRKNYEIFYSDECNNVFSEYQVEHAFSELGVDFGAVQGKKWYEFNKSDWEEKVFNALRLIQI